MFRLYECLSYDCIGLDGDRGEGNMAIYAHFPLYGSPSILDVQTFYFFSKPNRRQICAKPIGVSPDLSKTHEISTGSEPHLSKTH